jgi:hypothetical protein
VTCGTFAAEPGPPQRLLQMPGFSRSPPTSGGASRSPLRVFSDRFRRWFWRYPQQVFGSTTRPQREEAQNSTLALYVTIDDLLGRPGRLPGRKPKLADSELACLAVAQVLLACPSGLGRGADATPPRRTDLAEGTV